MLQLLFIILLIGVALLILSSIGVLLAKLFSLLQALLTKLFSLLKYLFFAALILGGFSVLFRFPILIVVGVVVFFVLMIIGFFGSSKLSNDIVSELITNKHSTIDKLVSKVSETATKEKMELTKRRRSIKKCLLYRRKGWRSSIRGECCYFSTS